MENKTMEKVIIPLVKKSESYKIIISEAIETKIRYLCKNMPNKEWSGTLFYTTKGSFETNDLEVTAIDLFVMDIGNAASTEFSMNHEVITYMTYNNLLEAQVGLIHSHHNMDTFFSATDVNTLMAEGSDINHFVSLIVNNACKYNAAITRKSEVVRELTEVSTYKSYNDVEKTDKRVTQNTNVEIEYFMLKVSFEKEPIIKHDELDTRIQELKERKLKDVEITSNRFTNINYKKTDGTFINSNKSSEPELQFKDSELDMAALSADIPYGKICYNKTLIANICKQIVTGSVIIPGSSSIDLKTWSAKMESFYIERFGKGVVGMKRFAYWAEGYIDFICTDTYVDANVSKYTEDDTVKSALLAHDLILALEDLPTNAYINKYIELLENYLF